MGRKIFKSGNSAVVSIPPEVMEVLGLETGDEVNVIADLEQCQIAIRPTSKTLEYR
ncbi:MAG: AbrB/MazE/SpoVT family DNA-binding domain-containing protein, partial [Anaerolineae bacterium]|nr:AbrB/MazE/SpoVT family DNA-binding domain-containing protein [Anaerolineae bacterium]